MHAFYREASPAAAGICGGQGAIQTIFVKMQKRRRPFVLAQLEKIRTSHSHQLPPTFLHK
jgi:hypothetical protein